MTAHTLSTGRQRSSPPEITVVAFFNTVHAVLTEGMGLEHAMFNTSSVSIAVGKLFQAEGDMGREKCIVGLQTEWETQAHPKLKCHAHAYLQCVCHHEIR